MTIPLFRRRGTDRSRIRRSVPRELSPRLMRDIGLDPMPECPCFLFYSFW